MALDDNDDDAGGWRQAFVDAPWWVKLLGGAVAGAAALAALRMIAKRLKGVLDFKSTTGLRSDVAAQLGGHNVLVLGPRGSGKTALLWFMENGEPARPQGGKAVGPDQTLGAVVVGKSFQINKDKWAKVPKDLSGELVTLWRTVIEEVKPSGVIYMVDPTSRSEQVPTIDNINSILEAEVDRMFEWVLDVYQNNKLPLQAFHVFLNFADKWGTPALTRLARRYTDDLIVERLEKTKAFSSTRVQVAVTQLAPDHSSWPEAQNAIDHFGADLGG